MLHHFKAWPSTAATCTETNKCQRPASQYAGQSQDTVEAKLEVATPPVRRSAVPIRLQELAWSSTYAPHRLVTPRMGLYACMCAHATYSATYARQSLNSRVSFPRLKIILRPPNRGDTIKISTTRVSIPGLKFVLRPPNRGDTIKISSCQTLVPKIRDEISETNRNH